MTHLAMQAPHAQHALADTHYDCWVSPEGEETAHFYRTPAGYRVRFPDQADFMIDRTSLVVECVPAGPDMLEQAQTLFHNSIEPMIGNYRGQLHMHGSAVHCGNGAVAFLGLSRSGKTTLAGGFARAGHPFLTEDVLSLTPQDNGFSVLPSRPILRLFDDSAAELLARAELVDGDEKLAVPAGPNLPHWPSAAPLSALFLLGPGTSEDPQILALPPAEALAQLMRHSFILDVEDRPRLSAHFDRLAALAETVPCHMLDYPRIFTALPDVVKAIADLATGSKQ